MKHAKLLSGLAGSAFVAVSVLGMAPAAQADGPGLSDFGTGNSGKARNDIGNYTPPSRQAPPAGTTNDTAGLDTQDILLGSAAGLVAVVGVAGAVISVRQRHAAHPA